MTPISAFAMTITVAGIEDLPPETSRTLSSEDVEDPVFRNGEGSVFRKLRGTCPRKRQGPHRRTTNRVPARKSYAAELLLDEPLPDDFESDEDDEVVDDEDDVEEGAGLEAGELLDEEPRLSLR
ncbi:hypothetical protein GCM10010317_060180 [Streptomyces mirabilis]|nr:hypothetical protein GCM10010317_060180 [Streptomyces mirabilis]